MIISENHNLQSINWVNGVQDPGEMIACAFLPELRRQDGEADADYAVRLERDCPLEIKEKLKAAAIERASYDTTGGKVAVMVTAESGGPPWAGLGTYVRGARTSAEAIKLARLDWQVELWRSWAFPVGIFPEAANGVKAEEARHVVRVLPDGTGKVLGTVGTRYEPFQNEHAFDFLDGLVGEKLAMFHTAGSLFGGKKVWVQCRIPRKYFVTPQDEIEAFTTVCTSHDGSSSIQVFGTDNRIVCNNTRRLAIRGAQGGILSIRHTASARSKVEKAKEHLGLVVQEHDAFLEQAKLLARTPMDERQLGRLARQIFPTEVKPQGHDGAALLESILKESSQKQALMEELLEAHYAESERTAAHNKKVLEVILDNYEGELARGTAWGGYNAVSEYTDHQMTSRGSDKASARLNSAWFGRGDEIKQQALEAALAFAAR